MDEDQRGEQTPKADGGTESSPTIKDTSINLIQDQGGSQHRDRKRFYWGLTRYESVSALIQGGLFFATLIYMIFAGLQWCTLRETLMISLLISSRPWAVISEVRTNGGSVPSQELKVQVAWKNVGNSPALQLKTSLILAVIRTPQIDKESPECPDDAAKFQSLSTLGPNIITYTSHGITIEPGDIAEAIQRGRKRLLDAEEQPIETLFMLIIGQVSAFSTIYSGRSLSPARKKTSYIEISHNHKLIAMT